MISCGTVLKGWGSLAPPQATPTSSADLSVQIMAEAEEEDGVWRTLIKSRDTRPLFLPLGNSVRIKVRRFNSDHKSERAKN